MTKKSGIFIGLAALIVLAAMTVYYYLTKSQTIDVSLDEGETYQIAGKYYEGKYGGRKLEEIFLQMIALLEHPDINGELVVLYYNDPAEEKGYVKNFIGILPKSESNFPDSLEVRSFYPEKTITVKIHSHPFVMPRPGKVRDLMYEKAEEEGYRLDSIFMEKYLGNEDIVVRRHIVKASD